MSTSESNDSQTVAPKSSKDEGKKRQKEKVKETLPKVPAAAPKSFARRDHLREIELRIQKQWEDAKIYEAEPDSTKPKFFVNFPYPYMNGRLHLGHAFSATKAEFTARFQKLQGKNVLYPFAFHCTGMPIQAAANKLRDEMAEFGCPPVFPSEEVSKDAAPEVEEKSAAAEIAAKSKGKKTKLIVKGQAGKAMRQWEILAKMVPAEDIASFADPIKWLNYFPPFGVSDLKAFGSAIDWRRSFITTSANPFYDRFISWQFNRLREGNRIKFGKRATVYSIRDGQVCADHDRASGEGVNPQEYTLIKLLIIQPYPEGSPLNDPALAGKNIYLAPATLRPETMYGQTNCFVLPDGVYGTFETSTGDVLVMSHRSARGLSYQGGLAKWAEAPSLVDIRGTDLLGLALKAPNAVYERVYTLPLLTISMSKGTGVVTSVPSDAPDDYVALKELKDKPLWREKFGLTAEMVEPFEVVPIISIEGYGDKSAETMCQRLDIKSTKDSEKLKIAKDEVYLKGYYEGVMLVGSCAGMKVCDAKPIVRQELISAGHALAYQEPESLVMSRSGDECIVALVDQWYLSYGDAEWRDIVKQHIHSPNFNGYNDKIMEKFDQVLDWLIEWGCSRQFGLGTKLPWDQSWVIESLSDSTIYMAYYTIAHYFHGSVDNMDGNDASPYGIQAADLTDEVFSFIFLDRALPEGFVTAVPAPLLQRMRDEFNYWYPMDLRVSARDLIPNHLTMCLYNHAEIWKDRPEMWPRGIYTNGHIMVDAEKMSKSKGNFLMLLECVEDFTADATRFACACAGDSMEDANFDRAVANQAITNLFNEEEWIRTIWAQYTEGQCRTGEKNFMDRSFENEINFLIEATFREFSNMCFRDGVCRCWFDLIIARDIYRDWSQRCATPMHEEVVQKFVHAILIMISPVCPHWAENLWGLVGGTGSITQASWPVAQPYDRLLRKQNMFFQDFLKNFRQANLKANVSSPTKQAEVYIVSVYEPKKVALLEYMQGLCAADGSMPADLLKAMKTFVEGRPDLKSDTKGLMQFGAFMRDEAKERGPDALATEMTFDQKAILEENAAYIKGALDLSAITFINVEDVTPESGIVVRDKRKMEQATPSKPSALIFV